MFWVCVGLGNQISLCGIMRPSLLIQMAVRERRRGPCAHGSRHINM